MESRFCPLVPKVFHDESLRGSLIVRGVETCDPRSSATTARLVLARRFSNDWSRVNLLPLEPESLIERLLETESHELEP